MVCTERDRVTQGSRQVGHSRLPEHDANACRVQNATGASVTISPDFTYDRVIRRGFPCVGYPFHHLSKPTVALQPSGTTIVVHSLVSPLSSSSTGKHRLHPQPPLPQVTSLPRGQSRPTEPDPPPEVRSQTPCPNGGPSSAKPAVPAGGDSGPAPRQAVGPSPQLPRMPCVSATGNGPNGRTIMGVLYRYTTSEVSIVCACHGSSFSPAEFGQHAGGTDVTHPLRQITVISS
ncbi:hypothetical protein Taro_013898 [Colocasia esculenta]|uniref:Ninja-family protein n=1 Tax=Colocasia esculenta TaxID=4460 RepID=A0A843UD00_COLES|nr:hypothetical protein [Colocasia esculenta]